MRFVENRKMILRVLVKICLWTLVFSFAIIALVFIPSITSLVSLVIAAIILPISKWQDILRKALPKKWINPALAVALTIVLLASIPTLATTSQSAEISEATANLMMPQTLVWYSFWHNITPHLLDSISYCLTNGVQFNQQTPSLLVPILVRAASADLLIWVCKDGNYPILEILHSQIGTILDVVPEYRHQLCDVITENRV